MAEPISLLQDHRWLVTTAIAAWGAGLSTYQEVVRRWQEAPNVDISLQIGEMPDAPVYVLGEHMNNVAALALNVKNTGGTEIRFDYDCCEIEVKTRPRTRLAVQPEYTDPHLPATIKQNHNVRLTLRAASVLKAVKEASNQKPTKVRVHIKDAVARSYRSRWIRID